MIRFKYFTEKTASIGNINESEFCQRIAEFYKSYNNPSEFIISSYTMLRNHINMMYDRIVDDLNIHIIESSIDPYQSDKEMVQDIAQNKTLKVYTGHSNHPFFRPEENIRFRVIHDYFSHYKPNQKGASIKGVSMKGHDFSFNGEMQAYRAHTRYVNNLPQINYALFSEIVGQVCYYNYYNDFPDPQKIVDFSEIFDVNNLSMDGFKND